MFFRKFFENLHSFECKFASLSFKKLLIAMLTLSFLLTSCDAKLGEEPPPPSSQEFGGTQCLTETKPVIKAFILGEAKKVELERSWDCVSSAVEKFKRYVRGRSGDSYSSQELATFLEDNFLDPESPKVSVELQYEFMKVKKLFVGGDDKHITRVEVDRLLSLFKILRDITINVNPYMKILALKWSLNGEEKLQGEIKFFEDANKEIQLAAKTLATVIEENGQSYKLSDFVTFVSLMGGLFEEDWDFPKTIQKYMPVVKKVKTTLAGGDEDLVTPKEWRRFGVLGSRGYILFLRYYYFIKSVPETGSGYKLSYLARTVEDLLSVFEDLVAEKPAGYVSKLEIVALLDTLGRVWPDFKTSPGLVNEAMKVKQLFFGGSMESFTRLDFETARLKVNRLKIMAERFLPYYLIYGREWQPEFYPYEESQKIFMDSQFVLEATLREAGALFEGAYDLNDALKLLKEVETLYPPENGGYQQLATSYMPLVIDLKNMILGGNDSSLAKGHWSVLLGFASRFYSDYLYFEYFVKGKDQTQVLTLDSMTILMDQSLNILRDLIAKKANTAFTRAELLNIVQHLSKLEIIPKMSLTSWNQLLGVVLNNILTPAEQRLAGKPETALTLTSLEVARSELRIYLDLQVHFASLTQGWSPLRGMTRLEFYENLQKASRQQGNTSNFQTGLQEMLMVIDTPMAMTFDALGRVQISNRIEHSYNFETMSQINMHRALSRALIRSFITDSKRLTSYQGVTLEEVEAAFQAVRAPVVELGVLDPKNVTFASSRFREANIFVPHSDGNSIASFTEMTDLVGMIFSGLKVNSLLEEDLSRHCFQGKKLTKTSTATLSCIRAAYKDSMRKHMTPTPEYIRYMNSASADEWAYYINNVFKAAGHVPNSKNTATVEDISLAPHVIQYIEMIYARFDKNKDGFISTTESMAAFPAFRGILFELAKDQIAKGSLKEKDLLDIFTYILRYGKPPETLKEKIGFALKWRGKQKNWDVWANRTQLSQILGYIADQTSQQKNRIIIDSFITE